MAIPVLVLAARLALTNPSATMAAVGGFFTFFWNKTFTQNGNSYTFDYLDEDESFTSIKTEASGFQSDLIDKVDTAISSENIKVDSFVSAVNTHSVNDVILDYTLDTLPVSNTDSVEKTSLISELKRANSNDLDLQSERNKILKNNFTISQEILKQQSLTNDLIKAQTSVMASRFANEQKQTIFSEALMHSVIEQLPAITLALSELGKISSNLKNLTEIHAINSRSIYSSLNETSSTLSTTLTKMSASHITHATDGYYAKSNESLDFSKLGTSTLKDSDGVQIKPREAIAKRNAEMEIETREMNQSKISEDVGFFEDYLQDLGNPLEILENLKESMFKEIDILNLSSDEKSSVLSSINSFDLTSYKGGLNENI